MFGVLAVTVTTCRRWNRERTNSIYYTTL